MKIYITKIKNDFILASNPERRNEKNFKRYKFCHVHTMCVHVSIPIVYVFMPFPYTNAARPQYKPTQPSESPSE